MNTVVTGIERQPLRIVGAVLLLTLAIGCAPADEVYLWRPDRGAERLSPGTEATRLTDRKTSPIGPAVIVEFAPGDSLGIIHLKPQDWRPFSTLVYRLANPDDAPVRLRLVIKHAGSHDHVTSVEHPLTVPPGQHDIRLQLADLYNVNRRRPDWQRVDRCYLVAEGATSLYVGDIRLIRGPREPSPPPPILPRPTDPPPPIHRPILFHTPEADAIVSRVQILPPDHPRNQDISAWPLHPDHDAMLDRLGRDLPLRVNYDQAYILVPPEQPLVDLAEPPEYLAESDPGPFPIPDNLPMESWPAGALDANGDPVPLEAIQTNAERFGGDRHASIFDPVNRILCEFFLMRRTPSGWVAAQASRFNLATGARRPDGWTSADAAGLPIFPYVIRHDELQRGLVDHAIRITFRSTRKAYVYPASHHASPHLDPLLPRMGERLRLRADLDIDGFSPEAQAILRGLKRYGAIVADNGQDWAMSMTPDPRHPKLQNELRFITGNDFEVVVAPTE